MNRLVIFIDSSSYFSFLFFIFLRAEANFFPSASASFRKSSGQIVRGLMRDEWCLTPPPFNPSS